MKQTAHFSTTFPFTINTLFKLLVHKFIHMSIPTIFELLLGFFFTPDVNEFKCLVVSLIYPFYYPLRPWPHYVWSGHTHELILYLTKCQRSNNFLSFSLQVLGELLSLLRVRKHTLYPPRWASCQISLGEPLSTVSKEPYQPLGTDSVGIVQVPSSHWPYLIIFLVEYIHISTHTITYKLIYLTHNARTYTCTYMQKSRHSFI